mmetsp:Transcript_43609/g.98979  ORF Transcript_43609/g.98979 Transcript_43609/m.98979 type:complete len:210 (-) Transcript_43609:20-649(-)
MTFWKSSAEPPLSGWHARERFRKAARTSASSAPSTKPSTRRLSFVRGRPLGDVSESSVEDEALALGHDLRLAPPVGAPGSASNSSQRRRTMEVWHTPRHCSSVAGALGSSKHQAASNSVSTHSSKSGSSPSPPACARASKSSLMAKREPTTSDSGARATLGSAAGMACWSSPWGVPLPSFFVTCCRGVSAMASSGLYGTLLFKALSCST